MGSTELKGRFVSLYLSKLYSAIGYTSKKAGAETCPYVDILRDARSAGNAANSARSAQEELIKGVR